MRAPAPRAAISWTAGAPRRLEAPRESQHVVHIDLRFGVIPYRDTDAGPAVYAATALDGRRRNSAAGSEGRRRRRWMLPSTVAATGWPMTKTRRTTRLGHDLHHADRAVLRDDARLEARLLPREAANEVLVDAVVGSPAIEQGAHRASCGAAEPGRRRRRARLLPLADRRLAERARRRLADHAVGDEATRALEADHRRLGRRPELPVGRRRGAAGAA